MENPFKYSSIATGESFCNREREQAELITNAKNSQNVVLFSHRRTGKTSLIHKVIERLKKTRPKVQAIYVDLLGTVSEREFVEKLFNGLSQIESKFEKIIKAVSGVNVTVGIDPLTGGPQWSLSLRPKEAGHYLENVMKYLASYSKKRKLMIVFDEFQEISKYAEKGFEKRLRSYIQHHQNICYIFSGSQRHLLLQMFNSVDRAFYQSANSFALAPIAPEHYIKWATALFKKKKGALLPSDIVRDILDRCELQPLPIQHYLSLLWKEAKFDLETIEGIERQVIESRRIMFEGTWGNLSLNHRKGLKLLASTDGLGLFNPQRLADAGFKSATYLQRALKALIEQQIITKNGGYHFQDVIFKKWVKSL